MRGGDHGWAMWLMCLLPGLCRGAGAAPIHAETPEGFGGNGAAPKEGAPAVRWAEKRGHSAAHLSLRVLRVELPDSRFSPLCTHLPTVLPSPYQRALFQLMQQELQRGGGGGRGSGALRGVNNVAMECRNICNHPLIRCVCVRGGGWLAGWVAG